MSPLELQTYGMDEKDEESTVDIAAQVVCVPDILRQELGSAICSVPVAVVLSEKDPSALAVQVPVTCSEPVTGAELHSKPNVDRSNWPSTLRHDDATFQVPVKSPPHGVRTAQASGVVLGLPPVADPPIPLTAPVFAPPVAAAPPVVAAVLTTDEPPVAMASAPPVAAVPPVSSSTFNFGPQATVESNAAKGRNVSPVFNEYVIPRWTAAGSKRLKVPSLSRIPRVPA